MAWPETKTGLVTGMKKGDDEAWQRFVAEYSGIIRGLLARRDGLANIDEVMGDLLGKLFIEFHGMQTDIRAFRAWLYVYVIRFGRRWHDRHNPLVLAIGGTTAQAVFAEIPAPTADDIYGALARARERLSTRERLILAMLLEGHTQVEIAGELGLSEARVSQLVRYIRVVLKEES